MDMTDEEIIYRYRHGAEPPKKMVKILADLNAVKESAIVQLLYEHGELSGQAIYHYRKSGKLLCADEDFKAKTKTKPHSVTPSHSRQVVTAPPTGVNPSQSASLTAPPKGSRDGGKGDPSQSAAPTASNREPSPCLEPEKRDTFMPGTVWKAPTIVLDKLKEWLNSNFTEYQEAKMKVQEYDEIFDFWKLIGGEDE